MQSLPFKILIIALAVTLLTPFSAFAQNAVAEKVFLKSGKSYTGEIVLRNDEVLILKLSDGTRFQFAAQDIEKIETVTSEEQQAEQNDHSGQAGLHVVAPAEAAFPDQPGTKSTGQT